MASASIRASAISPRRSTPAPSPATPAGALRTLTAPRAGLLPTANTKDQITAGLSLRLDEKRGSRHLQMDALRGCGVSGPFAGVALVGPGDLDMIVGDGLDGAG